MKLGTKEYYLDAFKHVLMTNLIISESQSLSSTYSYYEEQIGKTTSINEEVKKLYSRNLQKAFDEIKHEVIGSPED
ncbi:MULTISPECIES: hypothetical protein [Sporosarcina]|uniref:Uncharacterized protein n=1 Tax=Sporosarcina psychrophila TaxID=1476 RepID=A0ABV2K986_SPOPS|nr:hypothetical protein [Sporosarcina psychrophila]AMQ04531.1 hypothetical protein AZE41_00330 [Sporosarcina psychrophila]